MRISITLLLVLSCATSLHAAVHHSGELGWTEGQDISETFATLLKDRTLKLGDELVLDHTYRISGSHAVPDSVTISAVKGAGFDVTDAVDFKGSRPLLDLGNGTTLRNLTITYLNTPPLGPTGEERGVTFTGRVGIQASEKRDIRIENCRLTGSIGHHLKLSDCIAAKVIGCHVAGGHWTIRVVGGTDMVLRRCLVEKCQGDAIKTAQSNSGPVRRALVEECVFQDNLRDGIDLTGGFNDSVVRNCVFRRMGVSGMDIKASYDPRPGGIESQEPENVGILIENCLFHDMPNSLVVTTIDGGWRQGEVNAQLNASNMKKYAVHDIDINDCVFGHVEKPLRPSKEGGYGVNYPSDEGEHMRMLHLKDGYAIRYRNARFLGERIRPVYIDSIGGSRHLSKEAAEAIEPTVTGNVLDEPAPQVKPGITAVPFDCGPQID